MKISDIPLPSRMARLPRDKHGRVVPWFVAWVDGAPDHRVVGAGKLDDAMRFRVCWLCGEHLGAYGAFVIGPMCAINRISAEPPSHRDCALYAVEACPFLTTPNMRRRDSNLPEAAQEPDGIMIRRNPGAVLLWVSRDWKLHPRHQLWTVGDPVETRWYAEGRAATRDEVLASMASGLPILRAEAEQDPRPADAHAELDAQYARALELVPT
ncbi:hypothetical protein ACFYOF_16705 [Streptomyces sp. NPDC007148]|uniref:hypothetical protein n=1 Tax=Streptomyces sp. NPDC007148 TaxID=3364775 RepID=UPI0036CCCFC1